MDQPPTQREAAFFGGMSKMDKSPIQAEVAFMGGGDIQYTSISYKGRWFYSKLLCANETGVMYQLCGHLPAGKGTSIHLL